ncbi:MAG: type II toxin-antitoxin system RelE/ParE family toxin [Bacteroidota bacterium]
MARFKLSNHAVQDLKSIWNYTCNTWSEKQADRYFRFLMEHCHTVAQKPVPGKKYNSVNPDILGFDLKLANTSCFTSFYLTMRLLS